MIPEWQSNGELPPGVHFATLPEIEERLAFTAWRRQLFAGFRQACAELAKAGCRLVYLNGSFATKKRKPGDFDACWDIRGVDEKKLDAVFFDFSNGRAKQKAKFGGEFFPAQIPEGATGKAFLDFFQTSRLTGQAKGILAVTLRLEFSNDPERKTVSNQQGATRPVRRGHRKSRSAKEA